MRSAIRFIMTNAIAVFATCAIEMWCSWAPRCSIIITGSTVHTEVAAMCRSSTVQNRNRF